MDVEGNCSDLNRSTTSKFPDQNWGNSPC